MGVDISTCPQHKLTTLTQPQAISDDFLSSSRMNFVLKNAAVVLCSSVLLTGWSGVGGWELLRDSADTLDNSNWPRVNSCVSGGGAWEMEEGLMEQIERAGSITITDSLISQVLLNDSV